MQTRILLIEDNAADAQSIKTMVGGTENSSFALILAENLAVGIERLRRDKFDVVLLGLGLPESSKLDILQQVLSQVSEIPTIAMISGPEDGNIASDAIRLGARDCLFKKRLDSVLLFHAIRHGLDASRMDTKLRQVQAELAECNQVRDELKRNRDYLEQLVEQRTSDLAVAKKQAEMANRTKTAFLSSMNHELRTPLNAILGYAQVLKRDRRLSDRQMAGLNTIQQSGEHLLSLITDIFDLSKIENGKLELRSDTIDLSTFLRVTADIICVRAEQKNLIFVYDAAPDLPAAVQGDEKRLRQLLLNLLDNAVKFTEQGQVNLRIRCLPSSDATRAALYFEVLDTGIGMTKDQIEAIFRPFEPLNDAQRKTAGKGLGLAISQQLIRLMGGDIRVDSKPGKGSRFWFELSMPLEAGLPMPVPKRIITGYRGPQKKVLIVDDVLGNRAMLADQLSPFGFEIVEAANGQEGLEQIETSPPDLILMDTMMPVMDGLEATRRIRQMPELQNIPIIAVSASATQEDQIECLTNGASAFISKPIEEERLLTEIGRHLKLDWVYEDEADTKNGDSLFAPPYEEMQILYVLALAGNMRDIRQWAEHLAALDEQYRPFANKLHGLAKEYQSQTILDIVEEYMRGT